MSQIAALLLMYQDEEVILSSMENILKAAGFILYFRITTSGCFLVNVLSNVKWSSCYAWWVWLVLRTWILSHVLWIVGFFIPGFPKLLRFAKHHDKIIQKFLPKVWKHFKVDFIKNIFCTNWVDNCFHFKIRNLILTQLYTRLSGFSNAFLIGYHFRSL